MRHWPDMLPLPTGPGYGLTVADQHLRTDMESGPARTRRLTFARHDRIQVVWRFDKAEFEAFRAWFDDLAWSRAGHSDDLAAWNVFGAEWQPGAFLTPSGMLAGRLVETAVTSGHNLQRALDGILDGDAVRATLSLRASGRDHARVSIIGRDDVARWAEIDLVSGAVGATSGIDAVSSRWRGDGWYRIVLRASASAGAHAARLRVNALTAPGELSYAGDITRGVGIAEVNARCPSEPDFYLPTDAAGRVRGAAGGAAWSLIPVFTGGTIEPRECRFEQPFSSEVLAGMHVEVSAPVEVRYT